MIVIFNQIIMFFTFIIIGFLLGKTLLKNKEGTAILSTLLVYVFLPCNIIKTFSSQFTAHNIKENSLIILSSTVILLIIIAFSYFFAKLFTKSTYKRGLYEYIMVIPNYGYMGYAVMEAIFGEKALLSMMIFAIPVMLYTYTRGYSILTKKKANLKNLLNPILISVGVGMLIGILNIKLPEVLSSVMIKSSACMAPVSMLLTGITIASFEVKELFLDLRNYILTFLRLIVIPVCIAFSLKLLKLESVILPAVVLYSMPCGLNTIVFPKLVGEDCRIGASTAVISNLFACITIPLCISFLINI